MSEPPVVLAARTAEDTLDGAASWASTGWAVGHVCVIIGLIFVPLGWAALRNHLVNSRTQRLAYIAATPGYLGSALSISYYGAEVYGLGAIGHEPLPTATPP
ncbi:hypothetical protein [Nocardia sp. NPDC052112]|uniref:hypothetical protein n=1 Tax=Nocardia sp. NPDC052112 TaxID=3155646 RepID=UPI00343E6F8B